MILECALSEVQALDSAFQGRTCSALILIENTNNISQNCKSQTEMCKYMLLQFLKESITNTNYYLLGSITIFESLHLSKATTLNSDWAVLLHKNHGVMMNEKILSLTVNLISYRKVLSFLLFSM